MNRIITAIAAGVLAVSVAACSTPTEQAVDSAVLGSLAGVAIGGPTTDPAGPPAEGAANPPDYGAKKPHNHCGNGTMVHLGRVICSP
jgi:hypothetical protein